MSFTSDVIGRQRQIQDSLFKQQLEKERETQIKTDIERTEAEREKKKGKWLQGYGQGIKILKNCGLLGGYECKCCGNFGRSAGLTL